VAKVGALLGVRKRVFVASAFVLLGTALGCGRSTHNDENTGGTRPGTAGAGGTGGKSGAGAGAKGGKIGAGGTGAASGGGTATGGAPANGGESGEAGGPYNAGATATGGNAGSTGSVDLTQLRQTSVDKVDLLFMIDNSLSMTSKQTLLAASIPMLVERLITPACVDGSGVPTGVNADASGNCSQGAPEFMPVRDLHVGLITSSLGDHGSNDVCSDAQNAANVAANEPASNYNDLAQLLPSVRPDANLPSWNGSSSASARARSASDSGPHSRHTSASAATFAGPSAATCCGVRSLILSGCTWAAN